MAKATKFVRIETRVVGIQFRLKQQARWLLAEHVPFPAKIEREPENEKDEFAIKVYVDPKVDIWGGQFLGYIPKAVAKEISPALDRKQLRFASATVTGLQVPEGEGDLTLRFRKSTKG